MRHILARVRRVPVYLFRRIGRLRARWLGRKVRLAAQSLAFAERMARQAHVAANLIDERLAKGLDFEPEAAKTAREVEALWQERAAAGRVRLLDLQYRLEQATMRAPGERLDALALRKRGKQEKGK